MGVPAQVRILPSAFCPAQPRCLVGIPTCLVGCNPWWAPSFLWVCYPFFMAYLVVGCDPRCCTWLSTPPCHPPCMRMHWAHIPGCTPFSFRTTWLCASVQCTVLLPIGVASERPPWWSLPSIIRFLQWHSWAPWHWANAVMTAAGWKYMCQSKRKIYTNYRKTNIQYIKYPNK